MTPKNRNTAVLSPILLLLLLWSLSSTLRAVDGLFIKVCSCSGVYTPPSVFSNCSGYLVYPCPCPGEPQSSNEREFEMQIVPSRRSFNIHLMQVPLDGVSYTLIRVADGDTVIRDSVQQSPEKHELADNDIEENTEYRLMFCGWSNSTLCGCSSVDISTVNQFTPGDFEVLSVMSTEFKATWIAPYSSTQPSGYVLMYRALGSQETTTISYPGPTIPDGVIGNLLPTTTYSVQVRAEFPGGQSGTTGEFIVTIKADDPLAVQIFQNQLYSNPTSTIFIDKIINRQCEIDIGALLRNTRHYESFYEIRNVNHSLTSFGYDLQLRRIYYTTMEHSIYSMSYTEGQVEKQARFLGEGEQLIRNRGKALRSLHFDWSSGRLYWIEDNTTVVTSHANGSDVRTVFDVGVTIHDLELDPTHGYLYWLSSGQVRRYPLNLEVNCREKEELIPTNLSTVNDFALNTSSLETVLYRVNGSHLSVSGPDPGDMETLLPLNLSSAQTVLVSSVNLIILEEDKPFEVRNENLEVICASSTAEGGDVDVSVLNSQAQLPFSPPNPPSGFTFTITATSVNVSWISPSEGVPSFSKCASWRYRVEYDIGNGMQQSEVVTDTYFSHSQLTTGDPFTVRVIAEGQPGYSSTSPRFTVVPQSEADQMPLPLLLGTRSGLYRYDFREHAVIASSQTRVVSVAQDVLRNVTYILRDIGVYLQIGVVRDGSYSVLFERSNVESLTVDWVANMLYWIESGTVIMAGSIDPNRRERSTLIYTGSFTHLAIDPLHGLLFTSNGAAVTSQKVNNHQPQDNNVCSCKPDQILAMTADPDSQRLFWVSLRYSRLILNWASYTRETCNNSGQAVIPELELNMSMPRCVLAVSKGLLALKVENVNEIWTVPVALFDSLQVSSSPWLQPFSLPTGVGSAEEIYDFVFEQSNTAGLTPDVSAIPGAPNPIPSDGNAALDAITIRWSSVPFTASPLLYNVAYTLTRTNGSVESGSELTAMTSVVLDNQTPYTNVKVTVNAVSYWGSSADVAYSFRSTSAAPTDAVKNVTVSVYRARRGSDAVSVLVQWGLLTTEQLRGKGREYRVEVLQQGQSVVNVSFPPDRSFGFFEPSNSFQPMSDALYELQVYAVTEFPTVSGMEIGLSPPSNPVQFNSSAITPPLEVLLKDGSLLGDEQTQLDLRGPLEFDALLRTYYGFVERDGTSFLSSLAIAAGGGTQELTAVPSGTQVMSLVFDWISKDLYLLSTQGGQLVVYSWSTQGGQSLQTVYSGGTSLTEVTGRISPFSGTLYYALTASGDTTLFALDVREQGSRMPSHIFSGLPNGRRRRQACPDPPSFDLGQGFTTDADARAWMSSTDTGDIWSCAVSGTQLCNCKSEVSNASPSVQALAVDEARVYWTDTNGVFYVELSNRTVFITLSTMATTQLLATSPGLQQLPEDSCLYPQVDQQPTVQVSSVTNSTVFLTWLPAMLPSNCTQVVTSLAPLDYSVEYSPSGQNTISVLSNFETSITLTGLLAYTDYSVRVSGRNIFTPAAVADSLFGLRSTFITLPGVPEPPVSLSVVNFGTRALMATWLTPSEVFDDVAAVRYRITASADNVTSQITVTPASSREQVISGLELETMYTIQVVTLNSVHSSSPAEDSATTWALPPTLDATNITNTSVLLTASFPDLATPILQVVLQQNINGTWQNVSGVEDVGSTVPLMRMDLEPFEMYSYRLYGVYETLQDGTTHSAAGEPMNFRSQSGVPSVPVLLQPEGNVLRWDRLDGNGAEIIQLIISFKRTNGQLSKNVTIPFISDQTSLDTTFQENIDNDVQYNVTMIAVNAIGASQPSTPILFTKTQGIQTQEPNLLPTTEPILIGVIVSLAVLLMFGVGFMIIIWICCRSRRSRNHKTESLATTIDYHNIGQDNTEVVCFLNGTEDEWEIPRDGIEVGEKLSQGNYGAVFKGQLTVTTMSRQIAAHKREMDYEGKSYLNVAVKILRHSHQVHERKLFMDEIELMKRVSCGGNPHVLKMLACVTTTFPMMLILQYVSHGSLKDYLRVMKNDGNSRANGEDSAANGDLATDVTQVPHSCSSLTMETPMTSQLLEKFISFSYQIASGMEFLVLKGVIHRDLSCRNILVGDNELLKICDFGLAKETLEYMSPPALMKTELPIRWLPPEVFLRGEFSEKSDVWAYGVCLWEIFSFGERPYSELDNTVLLSSILAGYRLKSPKGCPDQIYSIMKECWKDDIGSRPTFQKLKEQFDGFISCRERYNYLTLDSKMLKAMEGVVPVPECTGLGQNAEDATADSAC